MKLGITFGGEMIYKDISEVGAPRETMTISTIEIGKIPIVGHQPKNSGGSSNRRIGYRQTLGEQSTVRSSVSRTHDKVKLTVDEGGEVNVNSDVKNDIRQGPHVIAPVDYGNVNDNYHRAVYQNNRGTAIYNIGLDVITPLPTVNRGLTLFDTVLIETPIEQAELAGLYVIVTQSIVIAQGAYHEKFELARRSAASNQVRATDNSTPYEPITASLYEDS